MGTTAGIEPAITARDLGQESFFPALTVLLGGGLLALVVAGHGAWPG